MTVERVLSKENVQNSESLIPMNVSVLLVDSDLTSLTIVSKMLRTFGYRVETAKQATEALSILYEREAELDLILTEIHLPDMGTYHFLKTLRQITSLPIVVLSSDGSQETMLGCLSEGAQFCLVKPISVNEAKSIWQFSYTTQRKATMDIAGVCRVSEESTGSNYADSLELLETTEEFDELFQDDNLAKLWKFINDP